MPVPGIVVTSILTVGAIVTGLDVDRISPGEKDELYAAWLKYGVLIFKGCVSNPEQHIRLTEVFGETEGVPPTFVTAAELIDELSAAFRKGRLAEAQANLEAASRQLLTADPAMAERVVLDAKMRRTGICGAMETLLIDRDFAGPAELVTALQQAGCEVRGDPVEAAFGDIVVPVSAEDWDTEYLAPIVSIRVVAGLDEAIDHINTYGSAHTDSIITENYSTGMRFLREVDSASVMVNASTRFADGFEYGLGAEIGISTDKFHARGPVGLEGLTSMKWVVLGQGEVRG